MSIFNDIPNSSALSSQPVNTRFNYLKDDIAKLMVENIGFGVRSGLVASAQTIPNMTVRLTQGVVYLPSGARISLSQTDVTISAPTTIAVTNEERTTGSSGEVTLSMGPLVTATGDYAGVNDIAIRIHGTQSTIQVSSVDPLTKVVGTAAAPDIAIDADYRYGQTRIDSITVDSSGNVVVLQGNPVNSGSSPQPPGIPSSSVELARITVAPKSITCIESADINTLIVDNLDTRRKGVYGALVNGEWYTYIGGTFMVESSGAITGEFTNINVSGSLRNPTPDTNLVIDDNLSVTGNIAVTGTVDGRNISDDWSTVSTHISNVVNDADTDATKNKHVSNALAKLWTDHKNATGNTHSTSHSQLTGIGAVDDTSTDATKDKHISNAMAKSYSDHINNLGTNKHLVIGTTSTTAFAGDQGLTAYNHAIVTGSNPHSTSHSQTTPVLAIIGGGDGTTAKHITDNTRTLLENHMKNSHTQTEKDAGYVTHLQLGETSTTAYVGDKGKTAYDHSQVVGSNPHNASHSQLSNIGQVNTGDTDATKDKHISNVLAKGWEDHRTATAPHSGHVLTSDVVTSAAANKILKLDSNSKLPASITGDAATVGGKSAANTANNLLVLDGNALIPLSQIPATMTGKDADTLDGYHASSFIVNNEVTNQIISTSGWYRVITTPSSGATSGGIVQIDWTANSGAVAGKAILSVGFSYNSVAAVAINQILYSSSSTTDGILKVRAVKFADSYGYVEVYLGSSIDTTISSRVLDGFQLTPITPSITDPEPAGGPTIKTITLVSGFAATGNISMGSGAEGDFSLSINNGAANSPAIKYDDTLNKWRLTHDGTTYNDITTLTYTAANKGGDTMTGALIAQSNTSYTTAQVRNVVMSTGDPTGGNNGDIWIKYI